MSYNIPTYTPGNFSFGPGILYVGTAGTTPSTDVGGVRSGAELAVTRERLEVVQGSARTLVQTYVLREDVKLTVNGIEWNLDRLIDVLGTGTTSALSASQTAYSFGGDINMSNRAVRFAHTMPNDDVIYVDLWSANGGGEITVSFGDDLHEFPYTFQALDSSLDWGGAALGATARLFRIVRDTT